MTTSSPLDGEISDLQAALAKDPRYLRLQQLQRLREDYLSLPLVAAQAPHQSNSESVARTDGQEAEARSPGRRRSPEREGALRETRSLLAGKTEPTRISDIDEHLERKGIRLNGNDPLNNLSALLSTSGYFTSHGKQGWTLSQ
jgi:hypothetical protein